MGDVARLVRAPQLLVAALGVLAGCWIALGRLATPPLSWWAALAAIGLGAAGSALGRRRDVTASPGGDIQAQLDALTAGSSVDAELAKMKAELGAGAPPPKEIGASGEESK